MSLLKKRDKFEEKLNEQLNGLEYKPSDALWNRIEQNLDTDGFEPAIQQKLASYSVEPTEKVWIEIENQLPQNRKRKGIIWFSWIAVILAIGFGAGYWFNPNKNLTIQKNISFLPAPVLLEPKAMDEAGTVKISEKILDKQQAGIPEKKSVISGNAHPLTLPKTDVYKAAINQKEISSKPQIAKSNHTIPAENNALAISETKASHAIQTKTSGRKHTTAQLPGSILNLTKPLTADSSSMASKSGSETATTASNKEPQTMLRDSLNENKPGSNSNAISEPGLQPIASKTNVLNPVSPDQQKTEMDAPNEAGIQKNQKDTFSEKPAVRTNDYGDPEQQLSNISITATIGAQMCFMNLSLPGSEMYHLEKSYELRKKMETPALDYNGGFLLNYHANSKWIISSGIQITSFRQTVKYSLIAPLDTNHNLVQPQTAYLNPKDSIVAGTANVLENKYSFTEIPLLVSYNIYNGQTIDFNLQAGLSYAFLNLVSAYVPDPGCVGLLNISDKNDFPKMKNIVFASFAPTIGFKINNTLTIGAVPSVKVSLSNMVDNNNWVQQRPWFVGINIFFRKRF